LRARGGKAPLLEYLGRVDDLRDVGAEKRKENDAKRERASQEKGGV